MQVRSEDPAPYTLEAAADSEEQIIQQAFRILERRMVARDAFHSPSAVREFLVMRAAGAADQHRERFGALWLDSQNRMISAEDLAEGTLSQTSVYPREVVRAALRHSAAAVIFTHNHPSGSVQPSRADEALTQNLKAALALVDVRVLDHVITSPNGQSLSMAEKGLI